MTTLVIWCEPEIHQKRISRRVRHQPLFIFYLLLFVVPVKHVIQRTILLPLHHNHKVDLTYYEMHS